MLPKSTSKTHAGELSETFHGGMYCQSNVHRCGETSARLSVTAGQRLQSNDDNGMLVAANEERILLRHGKAASALLMRILRGG